MQDVLEELRHSGSTEKWALIDLLIADVGSRRSRDGSVGVAREAEDGDDSDELHDGSGRKRRMCLFVFGANVFHSEVICVL
jgi:hypothetical protein